MKKNILLAIAALSLMACGNKSENGAGAAEGDSLQTEALAGENTKAKLKLKHIDLELQLNNLFDQRQYTRVSYSGLDIYTQTSQLRPRNIVATVRFKLL